MFCPVCLSRECRPLFEYFEYNAPPPGELPYPVDGPYRRWWWLCSICGHAFARFDPAVEDAVTKVEKDNSYSILAYRNMMGVKAAYERILSLPLTESDNFARVSTVQGYCYSRRLAGTLMLDVGAGLGVFGKRMRGLGWKVDSVERDPLLLAHLRDLALGTVVSDFVAGASELSSSYELISLVHIAEHFKCPGRLLDMVRPYLAVDGVLYIEVPWAEAAKEGPHHDEWLLDHRHVFSLASLSMKVGQAGYRMDRVEGVQDPSGKWVLRGFVSGIRN